ncbi:MAG: zinc metallopeptidase [Planctomycetota bacterium]|nr:MAG: zinc metallopeptidase [Planctomycetota bacterium]
MIGFDPLYLMMLAPAMLLAAWAQWKVKSAFSHGSKIRSASGLTGAQAAKRILESEGIYNVSIEPIDGMLSDHYDPTHKVLRLSSQVYGSNSIAALGVAAHEAGHAVQDATHYPLLVIRNAVVPIANIGSSASWVLIFAGMMLQITQLFILGVAAFSITVFFQVVNLPVEFDASRRARNALMMTGMVHPQEDREVGRVLNAAAMTYVAGTITSILTLVYYLIRSGLLGGSSDD